MKLFYNIDGDQLENKIQYTMINLVEHNFKNNFLSLAIESIYIT